MREFHSDIVTNLTNEAHPDVVFGTLITLRNAFVAMLDDLEEWERAVEGLNEARALLSNIMVELHETYGVPTPAEEDEDNAADL